MLPASDHYVTGSEGFLLKVSNETSINKLSPCAPRFNKTLLLFT